jgi:ABC-2 type transport system ATP-binding protein
MWDVVRGLVADGVTILLTTQYLEEADQLADRIGVLDAGRLVAEGTAAELKRMVPGSHVRLEFAGPEPLTRAATALGVPPAEEGALALEVPGDGSVATLKALLARLDDAGVDVAGLTVHTPDLDDVFLALTGRPTSAEVTA